MKDKNLKHVKAFEDINETNKKTSMPKSKLNWETVELKKVYVAKSGNFVFTLKKERQGVYSMGEAYLLRVRKKDDTKQEFIAAFWTQSDGGYEGYKKHSVDNKIWEEDGGTLFWIKKRAEELLKSEDYI